MAITSPTDVAYARVNPIWPVVIGIGLLVAVVWAAVIPAETLWRAWSGSCRPDWSAYWSDVNTGGKFLIFAWLAAGLPWYFSSAAASLGAIRRRALAGDDQLLPVAHTQSQPVEAAEMPSVGTVLGPFDRMRWQFRYPEMWILIPLCSFGAAGLVTGALVIGLSFSAPVYGLLLEELGIVSEILGVAALAAWLVVRRRLRSQIGPRVLVTSSGLSWGRRHRPSQRTSMDWHEARAFWRLTSGWSANPREHEAYVLEGVRNSLVWYVSDGGSLADQVAQHHLLCRMIVTRTNLPLRDYTAAAREIRTAQLAGPRAIQLLLAGGNPSISGEAARAILKPRTSVAGWLAIAVACVYVATTFVGNIAGWLTQHFLAC